MGIVMAILGFIALLMIGGYLCLAGLASAYVRAAFTGKFGVFWIVPTSIGLWMLYIAFKFSPITVTIT